MARAVARLGHEVAIYTTDREAAPAEIPAMAEPVMRDGVELRYFPQQFPRVVATSWPLAHALEKRIPAVDVVHLHSLYLFHDWAAARACRRSGVPYLLRPHGTLDPFIWRRHRARKRLLEVLFQNRVLREAAVIHFTAEEEMQLAGPYVRGAPGIVIPNGIEPTDYSSLPARGKLRRRHPEIGARRIVLFLGRINFKKGLDILVPAFAQALRATADLHLVIAGPDDGLQPQVEAWVREAGIAGHTSFTGMLTGADKLAALRDADIFALPSYSENFGIAVVEAMACGLPVLVSDKVNIWREIVAAGAGRAAPPDVAAFARLIGDLAAHPEAAAAMGERGRALVAERYAWGRIALELETVYRSLAAGAVRNGHKAGLRG